mgnify:CR=1 FL=1
MEVEKSRQSFLAWAKANAVPIVNTTQPTTIHEDNDDHNNHDPDDHSSDDDNFLKAIVASIGQRRLSQLS